MQKKIAFSPGVASFFKFSVYVSNSTHMFKILIPILIMTAFYEINHKLPCNKSAGEACTVTSSAEPASPQVFAEPQLENEMSFSTIDGSPTFKPQLSAPPEVSWPERKGDWIGLDRLKNAY